MILIPDSQASWLIPIALLMLIAQFSLAFAPLEWLYALASVAGVAYGGHERSHV